jgi:hypothetical protein
MQSIRGLARVARVLAVAAALQACLPVADAPVPPGYEALVDSARSNVIGNFEGLFRPSLAVTRIRCFADGGVVIMFRQVGGPTSGEPAFAMGGRQAVAPDAYAWSGGYGDMAAINDEIEFNFGGVPEIACPPRAN